MFGMSGLSVPSHRLRSPQAHRRGGSAIEFALLLPVFLVLVGGIIEFGWHFFVQSGASWALRSGCRAGAVVPADGNPEVRTDLVTRDLLAQAGIDCGGAGTTCAIDASLHEDPDGTTLRCEIALEVPPLMGLVPVPEQIVAATSMMRERG